MRFNRRGDRKGSGVEYLEIGDLVSVPFKVDAAAAGLVERRTGVAFTSTRRAGGAFGYVVWAVWMAGGRPDYVLVP